MLCPIALAAPRGQEEWVALAQLFRPYGKKRGERRTGSRRLGRVGEALFSFIFLAAGVVGFYLLLTQLVLPEWRASHRFVEHTCEILASDIRSDVDDNVTRYWPQLSIRYKVDEKSYEAWTYQVSPDYSNDRDESQQIVDQFEIGAEYPCWVDPDDPNTVVLVQSFRWWLWLLLLLPASFIVIGGGGVLFALLHSSTSAERRAALAKKAADIDLFDDADSRGVDYPKVPDCSHLTDSPGTELTYRLPVDISPGWKLFGMLAMAVFWNGVVILGCFGVTRGFIDGKGQWMPMLFLIPFVLIGIGIIVMFIRQVLITTGIGATRVEISDHPLLPCQEYEVFLSQAGRMKFNSLKMLLVCVEEATYQQGTDTRTATETVYRETVYEEANFEIQPGRAFEHHCKVRLPASAMHSFKSDHNEIRWSLIIQGDVARWPDYERRFPLIVYPGKGDLSTEPTEACEQSE